MNGITAQERPWLAADEWYQACLIPAKPSRLPCRRLRTPRTSWRVENAIAGMPLVRLVNRPLPTCVSQRCIGPSRSDMNATNLPSGEIDAIVSVPGKSVMRMKSASASGLTQVSAGPERGHTP